MILMTKIQENYNLSSLIDDCIEIHLTHYVGYIGPNFSIQSTERVT